MKKKLVALFLCCALSFGLVTAALITPASADSDFMVYDENGTPITTVELPENGSVRVDALLNESASGTFQWQIMARGVWANVVGATGSSLTLRYAMLANVLNGDGQATVRCRFTPLGAEALYSNTVTVQMTSGDVATTIPVDDADFNFTVLDPGSVVEHENAAPAQETPAQEAPAAPEGGSAPAEDTIVSDDNTVPAADAIIPAGDAIIPAADAIIPAADAIIPAADAVAPEAQLQTLSEGGTDDTAQQDGENSDPANAAPDVKKTYNIVIDYKFENGTTAADSYTATLAEGESFSATVVFPTVQGYLPYVGESAETQSTLELNYPSVSEDVTIHVTYKPTNVGFTVIHYQQNVNDDNYTEVKRDTTQQGLTGSQVPEVAKKYEGFYSLKYEQPNIAADGSTVIEVYYDRYYFLMLFDMDGGYGTDPIYVRYGASLGTVNEPTKAGYNFDGWALTKDGAKVELPATMPAENRTYYALWTPDATAKVTVVFWGENADDEDYSYLSKDKVINLKPGTEFTYSENGMLVCALEEHTHNDACLGCGKTEHTHSAVGGSCYTATCGITSHMHGPSCYPNTSNNESEAGTGAPSTPNNGYVYREAWNFSGGKVIYINGKWYKYNGNTSNGNTVSATCGLQENNHAHVASCYTLSCTTEEHTHVAACYTCGKTAHTHNSDCYMQGAGLDGALWEFDHSDTITVAADGSSVVNVYYNRVEYSVQFFNRNGNSEYTQHRITAKWGADIHDKWPTQNNSSRWFVGTSTNTAQNGIQIMPVGGAKYYGPSSGEYRSVATYYVEVLPGETGTAGPNNAYKWHHEDVSNQRGSTVSKDEFYDINGFTFNENLSTKTGQSYNGSKFYYDRKSYNLTFNNQENNINNSPISVLYQMPLGTYNFEPTEIPSWFEPGSVEFAGWYLNPQCTGKEYKLDEHTMPANDLILYAKWVPITHTVKFYLTEDTSAGVYTPKDANPASFTVDHGGNIAKAYVDANLTKEAMLKASPNGAYKFVVWYYYENGVKKYFDPTMQIRTDLTLFAEWSSDTLLQYTVRYVVQGTDTKVADDLTGSGLAGMTKTFDAKGGTELYADYQDGYFPTVKSKSLQLDIDSNELLVVFEYVQKEAVPYTVRYINTETNDSVFDGVTVADKYVGDNRKAVVTETFQVIPGFMPDAYQKRLVVTADGENILYFYYTRDSEHAYYKITHYTQNTDGKTWTVYAESQVKGDIDTTYTAEAMTIPGFTYIKSPENPLPESPARASGKLTADGLTLNLYYVRNSYPYQVRYLEQGTGNVLAPAKGGEGRYGTIVSESAIDIEGYDKVDPTTVSISIRIETNEEAKLNIITFYYTEKKVEIKYEAVGPAGVDFGSVDPTSEKVKLKNGTAAGSTPTAKDGFRFVGWYTDAACEHPVKGDGWLNGNTIKPQKNTGGENVAATYYAKFEYDVTDLSIIKTGCSENNQDQTFIFTVTSPNGFTQKVVIKGNGRVTLKGLKVGDTYIVTEDTNWSWRYTPDANPQSCTLQADADNEISFSNKLEKNKWLDGNAYFENIFKKGSAN